MADKREVFTVLELSTGEGTGWVKKAAGDSATSATLAPVVTAEDKDGNFSLIPVEIEGEDVGKSLPVLPVKDASGDLRHINARDEGNAISGVDALPVLGFKDPSGNFAYAKVNADGELIVSDPNDFTPIFDEATVTPSAINTKTEVVNLTLTAEAINDNIKAIGSSTFTTRWEIEAIADASGTPVVTKVGSFITGSGCFTYTFNPDLWTYTAGATGVQSLVLYGTQLVGAVSDLHGYMEVAELA